MGARSVRILASNELEGIFGYQMKVEEHLDFEKEYRRLPQRVRKAIPAKESSSVLA